MAAYAVVTPWHNPVQLERFLAAWKIGAIPHWLYLKQDKEKQGCARTKNRGITHAIEAGAKMIVVLDDDCFPSEEAPCLEALIERHAIALEPQAIPMFQVITDPPSRGTPYHNRHTFMPVAASMGYWLNVGDYDAPAQLIYGATNPMTFHRQPVYGRYFALSGMNLSFRANQFPYCQFINVPRFDDIWQGFIWQRHAYATGQCFNLNGPLVTHSRQSNVWANLRDEAQSLEANETLWQRIASSASHEYSDLCQLLPKQPSKPI